MAIEYANATRTRVGTVYEADSKKLMNLRTRVTDGISFLQGLAETLYIGVHMQVAEHGADGGQL